MSVSTFSEKEEDFVAQSDVFLERARTLYPAAAERSIEEVLAKPATCLRPVIFDGQLPTEGERHMLAKQFNDVGVACFIVGGEYSRQSPHLLLRIAEALSDLMPTKYPIDHPMEQHPEATARFGEPDGTLKIYDLPIPTGTDKYREQAETNEMFDSHNDGLGYGGKVATFALMLDSAPMWGGFTYFLNLVQVSLALANTDMDAFRSLFLPDAIAALRPRGKGAICVTTPVLYLNDAGGPQSFYRVSTGEYQISWRESCEPLARARRYLSRCTVPFGSSSMIAHLMRPGEGVFVQNEHVVHGRTPFIDGRDSQRVLARKWFARVPEDAKYKHVPATNVAREFAEMFPEFSPDRQCGEWHYDSSSGQNVKVSD